MSNGAASTLISLLVVALVARRELRTRTLRLGRLWIRPAIVVLVTLALIALAIFEAPSHVPVLLEWIAGGIAVGVVTGTMLLRFTTITPADRPDAIVVKGSLATVGVWLVVLLIRVAARFLFGGTTAASNIDASVGTVAVVAAALVVLSSAFHRTIVRTAR